MKINEIFYSIQGESTLAGVPTLFIRMFGCNVRCAYCDSKYAWEKQPSTDLEKIGVNLTPEDYTVMTPDEIIESVKNDLAGLDKNNAFICITGGEPLAQDHNELKELCVKLHTYLKGHAVISIETNGTIPIPWHFPFVYWIADIKTPTSKVGMDDYAIASLVRSLETKDEIKFVIGDEFDFKWSIDKVRRFIPEDMINNRNVMFSPMMSKKNPNWPRELAELIVKEKLPIRYQLQIHKVVWPDVERGV